jgi:hypothetical protein
MYVQTYSRSIERPNSSYQNKAEKKNELIHSNVNGLAHDQKTFSETVLGSARALPSSFPMLKTTEELRATLADPSKAD